MNPWQFTDLTRLGSPSSNLENLRRWLSCETTRSFVENCKERLAEPAKWRGRYESGDFFGETSILFD
jgi:hypothetical protein